MNKRILKSVSVILLSALAAGGVCAQTLNYVRKKAHPNFFIPQKDLVESKPEKVGLPQYKRGKTTAKHISADDNLEEIMAAKQRRFQTAQQNRNKPSKQSNDNEEYAPTQQTSASPSTSAPAVVEKNNNGNDVPDYQTKYQEYLKDLESIAKGGSLPNNPGIQDDLSAMNSEQRIEIDKNFNANRDVQSEVEKLLK